MKAEEMMLGDWVSFNGEPVKVVHIVSGINEDDYDPIPITAEILEKNGWRNVVSDDETPVMQIETRCDAFWWDSIKGECGCERSVYDNGEECIEKTFFCKRIYYVHELQHALRLCGIEKQITI